jgi:hypothetical protein
LFLASGEAIPHERITQILGKGGVIADRTLFDARNENVADRPGDGGIAALA